MASNPNNNAESLEDMSYTDFDLDTFSYDNFKSLINTFAYEGFDPLVMFEHLKGIAIDKGVPSNEFIGDMVSICVFYVTRGAKTTGPKITDKTSASGKALLEKLTAKYKIIDGKPGGKTSVNVARIIATFPHFVAKIMASNKDTRVVGMRPPSLPPYLCFPSAPALIPTDAVDLFDNWLIWAIDFDKTINAQARNRETRLPDPKAVEMYARISWASKLFDNSKRRAIMENLKNISEGRSGQKKR